MKPTTPAREFLRMAARGHARRLAAEKAKKPTPATLAHAGRATLPPAGAADCTEAGSVAGGFIQEQTQ